MVSEKFKLSKLMSGTPFIFVLTANECSSMHLSPQEKHCWWAEHQYNTKYSLWGMQDNRMYFKVPLPRSREQFRKSGWFIDANTGSLYVLCSQKLEEYQSCEYGIVLL